MKRLQDLEDMEENILNDKSALVFMALFYKSSISTNGILSFLNNKIGSF
jgi:hypothetical protein